ncbi:DUF2157 domain-containing protein [Myroides sp. NP-2]|uniref:DUF2157 domain-containing protein n=1 Tax=Myroides sp. NP-2 TaxID=2759945 RepID=UPI002106268C|nr:DUF2157 domain-containing protein [Myroides sp. NP-2]
MKEKKLNKRELFLFKAYSSIADQDFEVLYQQHGLASEKQWKDFIYWALLVCGIGFLVSGIVFFFAFNWDHMPVTVKFSLVGLGIVLSGYFAITPRVNESVNKISLLATTVLIGVLLAVFGQTYQTGANAYDLFLTWLIVATPLTLVGQSTYQWLFFSILANTTLILACVQRLQVDSIFVGILLLLLLNVVLLFLPLCKVLYRNFEIGNSYTQIQSVAMYLLATVGFGCWLFTNDSSYRPEELTGALWTLLLSLGLIGGGLVLGWMRKQIYLFSYALIAAISGGLMLWMKLFKDSSEGLLVYMLYAIGGIFFIIKMVSTKSKEWKHEN